MNQDTILDLGRNHRAAVRAMAPTATTDADEALAEARRFRAESAEKLTESRQLAAQLRDLRMWIEDHPDEWRRRLREHTAWIDANSTPSPTDPAPRQSSE